MTNIDQGQSRTGFLWDERYMWHWQTNAYGQMSAGGWVEPYPPIEHPDAKRRVKNLMDACGLTRQLVPIDSRLGTEEELCYFHTPEYVAHIRQGSGELGGMAGPFTPFGTGTFDIAARAVGGLIEVVDHVLDGRVNNAYAIIRPSGHHAQAHQGLGSCIFNNIVISAKHARLVRKLPKVAIVDFDVHHGNGEQEAFYADPSVLTISTHQRNWFTLKGEIEERGEGEGEGFNINVPLPSGTGDGGYIAAFERVVIPALRRFKPDLILVAAGYDAAAFDLTSSMIVSANGFRRMTELLVEVAQEVCDGKIVFEHEGGYNPSATPFCALACVEALSGIKTGIEDPHYVLIKDTPDQFLLPHQADMIEKARVAFGL